VKFSFPFDVVEERFKVRVKELMQHGEQASFALMLQLISLTSGKEMAAEFKRK
jgi:hypothetical protein